MLEVLIDALLDTLKILPILFLLRLMIVICLLLTSVL